MNGFFYSFEYGFSCLCLDGMGSYPAAREPARVSRDLATRPGTISWEYLGAVWCAVICDNPHLKTRFAKHVYEKSLNMFCKQCFAKQHVI